MSIFDRLFGPKEVQKKVIEAGQTFKIVEGYQPVFHDFRGCIYESALVRAAIDARARHISKLKCEIIGTAKPDLCAKLKRRPNPFATWSQFLYQVSTLLDVYNNVILVPIYDDDLNKIGFYPIVPRDAKIVTYKNELWVRYKFKTNNKYAACKLSECACLRKFQCNNPFFGESNIVLDETIDLMSINRQGIKQAVKNTAGYKFFATLTNFSKMADLEKEREAFSESAFGKEAKEKSGLLLFPVTYKDIHQIDFKPYTPDKDQINQINKNVYDYFGVNEDILENKASGDMWSAFYEGCVEVFSLQLSETLTFALFSEREISFGSEVVFTANRLQYMNFSDKLNFVQGMTDRGLLMIDEAREVFSLSPLPDGKGQVFPKRGEYHLLEEESTTEIDETNEEES